MSTTSTGKLIARAGALAAEARLALSGDAAPTRRGPETLADAVAALAEVVARQDARIAALEHLHPTAGLPLEGAAPLPLERRGA